MFVYDAFASYTNYTINVSRGDSNGSMDTDRMRLIRDKGKESVRCLVKRMVQGLICMCTRVCVCVALAPGTLEHPWLYLI